jgi:hypothetical protein
MVVKAVAPCLLNVVIGSGQEVSRESTGGFRGEKNKPGILADTYRIYGLLKASEEISKKGSFGFTDETSPILSLMTYLNKKPAFLLILLLRYQLYKPHIYPFEIIPEDNIANRDFCSPRYLIKFKY